MIEIVQRANKQDPRKHQPLLSNDDSVVGRCTTVGAVETNCGSLPSGFVELIEAQSRPSLKEAAVIVEPNRTIRE